MINKIKGIFSRKPAAAHHGPATEQVGTSPVAQIGMLLMNRGFNISSLDIAMHHLGSSQGQALSMAGSLYSVIYVRSNVLIPHKEMVAVESELKKARNCHAIKHVFWTFTEKAIV